MTSFAPRQCCSLGSLHEGEPTGDLIVLEGQVDAYLATPPNQVQSRNVGILYVPDILGIWQNSKLMADLFAVQGYTTLVLDIFNGDPAPFHMPDDYDIMGWISHGSNGSNPHTPEAIDPIILKGISHLKSLGLARIGAVGYCLGAKYVIRHYKNGIECGFIAHPSFVEADELATISGPLSIAAAENDDIFTTDKRHESESILAKTGQRYQINLFSGVEHGFAVRGDPSIAVQRFAKEQAFLQSIAWFEEIFI
ncbi:hypothetical protein CEP54_002871 [Fusarium duplospermum]|uniref:Dienelactone hydrolase domain-containing protein n=1 Tax=Fusarium duplospermum TaxID=1325734 RepID=A0A428QSP6_9HYPO|nr:hypothetical protein CEP54_002871 [Fusarium duplospermum]